MAREILEERRQALEEAFFRKQDEQRLAQMREQRERAADLEALAAACGVSERPALEALLAVGIRGETLPALALVPLVAVAWASGSVERAERAAVLEGAKQAGIEKGQGPYELLQGWLETRPPESLFDAWLEYARVFRTELDEEQRSAIREDVLRRASGVAKAAGGVLGLGRKISAAERKVLDAIEEAI